MNWGAVGRGLLKNMRYWEIESLLCINSSDLGFLLSQSVHKHQCPAPCSHKGCGRMLPATMLAYHMEEECEYRDVDCDDCGETMQYNQLQVCCQCGERGEWSLLCVCIQVHLDSQCPKRMVSCPNCQTRVLNSAVSVVYRALFNCAPALLLIHVTDGNSFNAAVPASTVCGLRYKGRRDCPGEIPTRK